jgi:Ca2+-binding RTX toxin-like protein
LAIATQHRPGFVPPNPRNYGSEIDLRNLRCRIRADRVAWMPRLGFGLAVLLASLVLAPEAGASLFTNIAPITVPGCAQNDCTTSGHGDPFPSTIHVDGLPPVARVRVTVRGIDHTAPDDIDAQLVGPGGERVLFMSDACAGSPLSAVSLMFEDGHPTLPASGACAPAVYSPTNYGTPDPFEPPAPPAPYGASFSDFTGKSSNGDWKLFARDDLSGGGGVGEINGGWRLELLPQVSCAGRAPSDYANVGTSGADFITGTPGADVLFGLGGNDTINGLGGKDVICGGDGDDLLLGGPGKDLLRGEGGRDKLRGQGGKDTCAGGGGKDRAKACEKVKSL